MTPRRAIARTLTVTAAWAATVAALVGIDLLARTDQIPAAPLWQIVLAVGAITVAGHTIHTTRETTVFGRDPQDPLTKRAAEALMRHGDYSERPDAIEWLIAEAGDVADVIEQGLGPDSVVGVLADTAWWDPENENDERARRVYADVAIHTTRETP